MFFLDFFSSLRVFLYTAVLLRLVIYRILTPTIIEAMSFRAWLDEAYTIWREWQRIYPAKSQTSQLLKDLHDDVWLVNVIHNRYVDDRVLWDLLLKD